MKVIKETENLSAVGPYSLAIEKEGVLYLSGQIGINKELKLVSGGIKAEFKKIIENTEQLVGELDYTLEDIVQIKNYLLSLDDFAAVNELYKEYFTEPYPTRTTLQVAGIPLNASIEVEMLLVKEN